MKNIHLPIAIAVLISVLLIEVQIMTLVFLERSNSHLWGQQLDLNESVIKTIEQQCTYGL